MQMANVFCLHPMQHCLEAAICQSEVQIHSTAEGSMLSYTDMRTDHVFQLKILADERAPSEAIRRLAEVSGGSIRQFKWLFKLYFGL